jgi:hypothetical protein
MLDLFAVHLTANGGSPQGAVVVMLPATDYRIAIAAALKQHPGGQVDSVRRLDRRVERAEQLDLIKEI